MILDSLLRVRGGARLREAMLRRSYIAPRRLRAYWFTRIQNFGDELSSAVLEWVSGSRPVWVSERYEGKTLAIGSILQDALAPRDMVWGSGLIEDERLVPPSDARFLAVRGPLTRSRIDGDVPEVYGDPALLLPIFHHHESPKRHRIGVVPHYVDRSAVTIQDPAVSIIDVGQPWRVVVDRIRGCEVVVSSSLHGLIIAEAYGIPSVWVRITNEVIGGAFKFNDYLRATGRDKREPVPWERGLDHALKNLLPDSVYDPEPLLKSAVHLVHSTQRSN